MCAFIAIMMPPRPKISVIYVPEACNSTRTTLRFDPVVPSLERPIKLRKPAVGHAQDAGRFGSSARVLPHGTV